MEITNIKEALAAVTENGLALFDVPEALRTPEIRRVAAKQNVYELKYVPDAISVKRWRLKK